MYNRNMTVTGGIMTQATPFRRNAGMKVSPLAPRARPFTSGKDRSRKLVVQAKFRRGGKQEEPLEEPETKTTFLRGIFGGAKSGTQRLKAGQPTEESAAPRQKAARAPKTPAKKSEPTGPSKKSAPGGFLQTARIGRKEQNTVFVAGATGRLGLRIVRELLLAGFKVRAGARNTDKAQKYANVAGDLGLLPSDALKRLQIVPVDLEDPSSISAAIGNATRVVQAIGAAENNVLDFGAPKRIDGTAAIDLVNASVEAGITQYVMVTSLGTGKFGWPASALNLFGGILIQKRRAEKALEASGLNYTIVRPGGMEKPTDEYKKTNNVRLSTANKLFGGQVSRLQVAELITSALANPELASSKVLEVVAESTAPKLDYETLLQNFETDNFVAETEVEAEEEEEEQPVPEAPPQPPRRTPKRRPQPKQRAGKAEDESLSGNQDAIAEGIAQKEIDIKLKKDAPEPSQEDKNIAEDIAKAEIQIDSGKESPTRSWFGLGGSKAKGKAADVSSETESTTEADAPASTSSAVTEAVKAPVKAAQKVVKKAAQDPEEVDRLNAARAKSAEDRAKREADFLARLETQRQEDAQKKKQAAEKREREALEKSRKDRDALFAKQEEEARVYREQTAKWQAETAERVAAEKAAKAQPAAQAPQEASKPEATDAAEAAKKSAQEARKWIDEWRSGQSSGKSADPSANGSAPVAESAPAEAPKAEAKNGASSSAAKEARAWIEDWRSRTGAKS